MFNYYWATGRIIFPRFHCGSGSNGSLGEKKRYIASSQSKLKIENDAKIFSQGCRNKR